VGEDYQRQVLNRWKSIEGHVRGVRRMLEEGVYCPDVIKQTTAVQGAIDSVNALVLEHHLHTCAAAAIRGGDPNERERVIGELLQLFRSGPRASWNRSLPPPAVSWPEFLVAGEVAAEDAAGAAAAVAARGASPLRPARAQEHAPERVQEKVS
jgi:CsoR family transcriptional regulator, copper-sensing transcriptional repressor